jgi:hypothetical protein
MTNKVAHNICCKPGYFDISIFHHSVPTLLLLSTEGITCLVGGGSGVEDVEFVSGSESRLGLTGPPPPAPAADESIRPSEVKLNAPVEEDDEANRCLTAGASGEDDAD